MGLNELGSENEYQLSAKMNAGVGSGDAKYELCVVNLASVWGELVILIVFEKLK
jgi:hypothetical protein